MRKFSYIFGWHLLFVFLLPLFGGFLVASIIYGFEVYSYCSLLSSDFETLEGRIVDKTNPYKRMSSGSSPTGPFCKIEYDDKQMCKHFLYAAEKGYFPDKNIGDSITFKTDGSKIIIVNHNDILLGDIVALLGFFAFSAISFPAIVLAGVLLRNYENETYRGKERVTLVIVRLLMLCGACVAFYVAALRIKDDLFPNGGEVETARILSIDQNKSDLLITAKSSIDKKETLITHTINYPFAPLSTGQKVEIFFPKNDTPRLVSSATEKTVHAALFFYSFYLLFVSVSAFFRRRKSYKPSVLPEDYVELPPFVPYKG